MTKKAEEIGEEGVDLDVVQRNVLKEREAALRKQLKAYGIIS